MCHHHPLPGHAAFSSASMLLTAVLGWTGAALGQASAGAEAGAARRESANAAYRLVVTLENGAPRATVEDKTTGLTVADGPCLYRAVRAGEPGATPADGLKETSLASDGETLTIRGRLAGLTLEHTFILPAARPIMEERVVLRNDTTARVALADFETGLTRRVADRDGQVGADLADDRWVAVPFRIRPTDPKGHYNDFSIAELISKPGYEPWMDGDQRLEQTPSRHRRSEGWAWTHGTHTLGIFSFCQENMVFHVVSTQTNPEGVFLRLGGACMISGEPAALTRIAPGQKVDFGVMRYQTVPGGYREAMYAYRAMLDEQGYRRLERLYKHGDFYGISEEIHLHALPEEGTFVVNAFNLSDQSRTIAGEITLKELGLEPERPYAGSAEWANVRAGRVQVKLELPPWGARVAEFKPGAGR